MRGPALLGFPVCSVLWEALPLSEPNYIQSIFKQWAACGGAPWGGRAYLGKGFRRIPLLVRRRSLSTSLAPMMQREVQVHSGKVVIGGGFLGRSAVPLQGLGCPSISFILRGEGFARSIWSLEGHSALQWGFLLPHPQCCPPLPKYRSRVLLQKAGSSRPCWPSSLGSSCCRDYSCWGVHCSLPEHLRGLALPSSCAQEPSCRPFAGAAL